MAVFLELVSDGRPMLWAALDKALMSLGRNPECDVCIPNDHVGEIQCLIRSQGPAVVLVNRHPDGTRVNGELVHNEMPLADGDTLDLGPVTGRVRFRTETVSAGGTRTLSPDAGPRPAKRLEVTVPEEFPGRRWILDRKGLTFGSDPSNDIVLSDPYVSRFHMRLVLEQGRCMVYDLGSRNGVFLGPQKIREGEVQVPGQAKVGQTVVKVGAPDQGEDVPAPLTGATRLVGRSVLMEVVRDLVRRLADADAPVLIGGETGTGKEVVARLLHELSPRSDKSFVVLNCGALSPNLIESELFGHEKGAFTGAIGRRQGAFEAADGGTLFLDEIGELPLELQPQLLRTVENGEVRRVGTHTAFRVDVRLIAATNRRLEVEVDAGRFRQDLFHRLNVLEIELPPLRERPEDIGELVQHFLNEFSPSKPRIAIAPKALRKFERHEWPGNVRELRNVVQRALLMRKGQRIEEADVIFSARRLVDRVQAQSAVSSRTLSQLERDALVAELVRHQGNKSEAAVSLGVSRSTIHRKIEEHKIDVGQLLRLHCKTD